MDYPEIYRIRNGKKIRFYFRKAYKKARHKRSASRFPYEEWI